VSDPFSGDPALPTIPKSNEFDLAHRPKAVAERLEKMRKKLAAGPALQEPKPETAGARRRRKAGRSFWWAVVAGVLLVGINFMAISRKDLILEAMGARVIVKPLAPPPGLEQDELARFWAYAAFDEAKLKSRFAIPKNVILDPVDARHHLEDLLSRGGLGEKIRAEVALLRGAAPEEPAPKAVPVERMRGAFTAEPLRSTVPAELINSAIPTERPR
jgi:hypothetical protein